MSGVEVVVGGIVVSVVLVGGMAELLTGRIARYARSLNWSAGEVRVSGLVTVTTALVLSVYMLASGFDSGSVPAMFLACLALLTTTLVLEQHHHQRWPFNRASSTGARRADP